MNVRHLFLPRAPSAKPVCTLADGLIAAAPGGDDESVGEEVLGQGSEIQAVLGDVRYSFRMVPNNLHWYYSYTVNSRPSIKVYEYSRVKPV
jgi:hypothetical protein